MKDSFSALIKKTQKVLQVLSNGRNGRKSTRILWHTCSSLYTLKLIQRNMQLTLLYKRKIVWWFDIGIVCFLGPVHFHASVHTTVWGGCKSSKERWKIVFWVRAMACSGIKISTFFFNPLGFVFQAWFIFEGMCWNSRVCSPRVLNVLKFLRHLELETKVQRHNRERFQHLLWCE